MNRLIRTFVIAALVASVSPLKAQQPSPEIQKLSENIDVRVINVDVVVTDKKGNSIRGLTKDDFDLFENGVPKPLSNFYEVEGKMATQVVIAPATPNAVPPPPPPKSAREARSPSHCSLRTPSAGTTRSVWATPSSTEALSWSACPTT